MTSQKPLIVVLSLGSNSIMAVRFAVTTGTATLLKFFMDLCVLFERVTTCCGWTADLTLQSRAIKMTAFNIKQQSFTECPDTVFGKISAQLQCH